MQRVESKNSTPGIIDTLSTGFETINRALWILALPVFVDLVLWLGPKVTIASLVNQLLASYREMLVISAEAGMDGGLAQMPEVIDSLSQGATQFNLLTLLVLTIAGVPSVGPPSLGTLGGTVEVSSLGLAVLFGLALQFGGIFLGCLYRGGIAQRVRDGRSNLARLWTVAPRYFLSIVGFLLLLLGAFLAVSVPLTIIVALAQALVPGLGLALISVANLAFGLFVIWMTVYLYFLVDAIVLRGLGPVRAASSSARVVSNNFWTSLGFIGLSFLILAGMQQVWGLLDENPIGLGIAILGNAYIASGLAAASMLFYRSRADRLPPVGAGSVRGAR